MPKPSESLHQANSPHQPKRIKKILHGLTSTAPFVPFLICLFIGIFGPALAPYDWDHQENFLYNASGDIISVSPHEPSAEHVLGTDEWGYDYLSRLLYGARYTILGTLFAALFRTAAAFFIGLLRGINKGNSRRNRSSRNKSSKKGLLGKSGKSVKSGKSRKPQQGFSITTAIPVFIIMYFVLFGINFNPQWSPLTMAVIQFGFLSFLGIPTVIPVFEKKTRILMNSPFIEAAEATGASKWDLIKTHLYPHMKELTLIVCLQEIISVLTVLGQLGIFYIFVGGTILTRRPPVYISKTYEWGGLIGRYRGYFNAEQSWLLFAPLGLYLIYFLSAYLASRTAELRLAKTFKESPKI